MQSADPTLADQIIKAAASNVIFPSIGKPLKTAAVEIERAQRFLISKEVRDAAAHLILSRPTTLIEALQFARPPFPKTWLEWAAYPRDDLKLSPVQVRPVRTGAMITQTAPQAYTIWTGWSYSIAEAAEHARKNHGQEVADVVRAHDPCVGVSSTHVLVDLTPPIEAPSILIRPPWVLLHCVKSMSAERMAELRDDRRNPLRYAIKDIREREALESLDRRLGYAIRDSKLVADLASLYGVAETANAALTDVQEEIAPCLAMLMLLNSRNCVDVAAVERPAKLNKARAKAGKPRLLDYSTVTIDLSRVQRNVAAARGMSHVQMQMQLVRGHFKVRKTGVFWWSPHTRGELGRVEPKRYEVVGEPR